MIPRYLPSAIAALAVCAGLWWLVALVQDREALRAENASLARSVGALEQGRDQARLAAAVARAEAARQAARAAEYDRMKETILKGNHDEPLPDWLRDHLDQLLGELR